MEKSMLGLRQKTDGSAVSRNRSYLSPQRAVSPEGQARAGASISLS